MYPAPNIVKNHRIECKHGLDIMRCKGCRIIYLNTGRVPGGKLVDDEDERLLKKKKDRQLEKSLLNDVMRGR